MKKILSILLTLILFVGVGYCKEKKEAKIVAISAGSDRTLALKDDGTVTFCGWIGNIYGSRLKLKKFKDIVAIGTQAGCAAGLTKKGTVILAEYFYEYAGYFKYNTKWHDIKAISVGGANQNTFVVGLKNDGTVRFSGSEECYYDDGITTGFKNERILNVDGWKDIVAISAGTRTILGLKSDGTVVATGDNTNGQCNVINWKDITAVSAGTYFSAGLKNDGTVIISDNAYEELNMQDVENWKDIVAISAGTKHLVGLKSDGTVVAVGDNNYSQCNVSDWQDISSISAGDFFTVGLRADGTTVGTGKNNYGQSGLQWGQRTYEWFWVDYGSNKMYKKVKKLEE
jgi:alpha-tubulin suppressor-like RCC1 family protein